MKSDSATHLYSRVMFLFAGLIIAIITVVLAVAVDIIDLPPFTSKTDPVPATLPSVDSPALAAAPTSTVPATDDPTDTPIPPAVILVPSVEKTPTPIISTVTSTNTIAPPSPTTTPTGTSTLKPSAIPTQPAIPVIVEIPQQPILDQVVIQFEPGTTQQQRTEYIQSIGGTVSQNIDALDTVVVNVPAEVAAQPLPESIVVATSEPDYYVTALDGPLTSPYNDPLYSQQWALPVIGAPEAWAALPADAPKVTVAVIDSGVCADHPDLTGRIQAGWDFLESDADPQDAFGHGCAVTGVIAANINDGIGMAGVAPNAQIMPLRVLDAQGVGSYSDVAAAIVYATDNGAQVINLSLGGASPSTVLETAVNYADSHGVTIVAAAGNTGQEGVLYPARYEPVIAVGSVDQSLERSSFSSYGPEIDLLAPGRDILTTKRDGSYGVMSGTSFAAPYVAGEAVIGVALGRDLVLTGNVVSLYPRENEIATSTPTVTDIPVTTPTIDPPTEKSSLFQIDFETVVSVPDYLQSSIYELMTSQSAMLSQSSRFFSTAFRVSDTGEWARVVLVPSYVIESGWENLSIEDVIEILINRDAEGTWHAYMYNGENFDSIALSVPPSFIDFSASVVPFSAEEYRFPWTTGQSWWKNGGWHTQGYPGLQPNAIDFQSKSVDNIAILAAASGLLETVCGPDSKGQIWLKISNADGTTGYGHLDNATVRSDLIGKSVLRGQFLGNLYSPSASFESSCGSGAKRHIHFVFPDRGISMYDAATSRNIPAGDIGIDTGIGAVSYTSNNQRIDNGGSDTTPPTGGFTSPTDNSTVGTSVTLAGNANDTSGIREVRFTAKWPGKEWHVVYTDPSAPYSYNWDLCASNVPNGVTIELGFDITDNAGNNAYSPNGPRKITKTGDCNSTPPTLPPQNGNWTATYYDTIDRWNDTNNNGNLRCSETITGPTLDVNYGINARCGMDGDSWVGDYSATIYFQSGNYVFRAEHDDGMKLWVNGQGPRTWDSSESGWDCPARSLSGNVNLRVLLREDGGDARVKLIWTNDTSVCITAPAAPSLNSPADNYAFNRTDNVSLAWNTSSGATSYYAELWGGTISGSINTTWKSDTAWFIGQTWGGTYYWHVKARNNAGESAWSPTRTFTIKYGSPSNLRTSATTSSQVSLSWDKSADDPGNMDGYRIYRNGSAIATVGTGTSTYANSGLSCGSTYSYFVRAYKGGTESNSSNTVSATTNACVPNPPTLTYPGHSSTLAVRDVTFLWQSPNSANQTGYIFRISQYASPNTSPWLVNTSLDNNTLAYSYHFANNGTYYWHMLTTTSTGSSSSWITHSFVINAGPPTVKLINVFTTDENGTAASLSDEPQTLALNEGPQATAIKTTFNAGDPIRFYIELTNELSTNQTVDLQWQVSDPSGQTILYLSEPRTYEAGGWYTWWPTTMPTDSLNGDYVFIGYLTYNGKTTTARTTFHVNGIYAVKAEMAYSTDENGTASSLSNGPIAGMSDVTGNAVKVTFNAGDPIQLHLDIYNNVADGATAYFTWQVTDPWGRKVPELGWSGNLNSGMGRIEWYLPATIPTHAISGQYSFTGSVEYSSYISSAAAIFTVNGSAGPSNNDFSTPIGVTAVPYLSSVDTWAATTASDDPIPTCGNGTQHSNSVWYRYTPSANGILYLDTAGFGSNYDTVVAVWRGTRGSLTQVGCNDDASNSLQSRLETTLNSGVVYYIEVMDYGTPGGGNLELYVDFVPLASNDDFNSSTLITSLPFNRSQNNGGATKATDDPIPSCGGNVGKTVWYKYSATAVKTIQFQTAGSSFDTVMSIWTGSRGNLTEVACNDDNGGNLSSLINFTTVPSATYYIMVGGFGGARGSLAFTATEIPFCNAVTEIPTTECQALLSLYDSTNGPNWNDQPGWKQSYTPCSWYGVSCNENHVTGLRLNFNRLVGSIPPTMRDLPYLKEVELVQNSLSGNIPPELGDLPNLTSLRLYRNSLTGSVPSRLGNLNTLQVLDLGRNQLSGSIPPELGNLSNLQGLYLGYNQLSGSIPPELGGLTGLQDLQLDHNQLSGDIPPELENLANLQGLSLGYNQLSGGIPPILANLDLIGLDLEYNYLSGTIPPELGNLASLHGLNLSNNLLSGTIPPELGNLTSLYELNLSGNQLSGNIPIVIANLNNLGQLDMGYNMLRATDPALITFLNTEDPDWATTQTVPPGNVQITALTSSSMQVSWSPITYTDNGGYYEVSYAQTPGGPYTAGCTTANKIVSTCTVSNGLLSGTRYYVVIRTFTPAHDTQKNPLWSNYSSESVVDLPLASPTALAASTTSETQITLTWTDNTPNETAFRIERSPDGTTGWVQIGTTAANTTTFTNNSLTNGTRYYYRVRAYRSSDGQYSAYSNIANAMTWLYPPDLLTLTDGAYTNDTTPAFTWSGVTGATMYRLQVAKNASFTAPLAVNVTRTVPNFTATSALADGKWYWRVQVQNANSAWGNWSAAWSFTVDTIKPVKPVLSTPATNTTVFINQPEFAWTDASNPAGSLLSYRVQVDNTSTFTSPEVTGQPVGLSFVPTAPLGDTVYYWRVQAVDLAGNISDWSPTWNVRVDAVPAAVPVLFAPAEGALVNTTSPTFTWGDLSGDGIKTYRFQIGNDLAFASLRVNTTLTAATYKASGLPNNTLYWRVQSRGADGAWGAFSSPRSFTVNTTLPPKTTLQGPGNNTTVTTDQPTFQWAASTVTDFDHYEFQLDNSSAFTSLEISEPSLIDAQFIPTSGYLPDGKYYWRVQVVDTAGNKSGWTGTFAVTISATDTPVPTLLTLAEGAITNDNTPTLTWTPVPGALAYRVQIDDSADGLSPVVNVTRNVPNFTAGLLASKPWHWRVQAQGGDGQWGDWSALRSFTVDTGKPVKPILFTPTNGTTVTISQTTLSWTDTSNAPGSLAYYRIQVDNNSTFTSPEAVSQPIGTSYTPTLADGLYYWRVQAVDLAGNASDWSPIWTLRVDAVATPVPTLLTLANGSLTNDNTPTLTWEAVPGALQYRIQIDDSADGLTPVVNVTRSVPNFTSGTLANKPWYWRVQAQGADGIWGNWSTIQSFTVDIAAPPKIALQSPLNNASEPTDHPLFRWDDSAADDFAHYEFQLDNLATFASPEIYEQLVPTVQFTPASGLLPDAKYYWRVRVVDQAGNKSGWSGTFTLTISAQPTPLTTLLTPAQAVITNDNTPTFTWSAVPGAMRYQVRIDNNADCLTPAVNVARTTPDFTAGALANGLWYWCVQVTSGDNQPGGWTAPRSFTVDTVKPVKPVLSGPATNTTTALSAPTFSWTDASNPASSLAYYRIQIDNTSNFSSPEAVGQPTSLSYAPTLVDGLYYWRVQAVDLAGNGSDWSATWNLRVDAEPTTIPTLLTLTDGSITRDNTPSLTWEGVAGARLYRVQIDDTANCSSPAVNVTRSVPNFTAGTLANKVWYWRVQTQGADGTWSEWSTIWFFTVDTAAPPRPTLQQPANNSTALTSQPEFTWTPYTGADFARYEIQVDNQSTFTSPEINEVNVLALPYTPAEGLLADGKSYWRVRTVDQAGNLSIWSATFAVMVNGQPTPAPQHLTLADGSITNDTTPTLTWGTVPGALAYRVQLSREASCITPALTVSRTVTNYTPTTALSAGTWYWCLQAQGADSEWSEWGASTVWAFDLDVTPPAQPVLVSPAAGSTVTAAPLTLDWSDGPDAHHYEVQVAATAAFTAPLTLEQLNVLESSTTLAPLPADTSYYWRVRAVDAAGNTSGWTSALRFTLDVVASPAGMTALVVETPAPTEPPAVEPTVEPTTEPTIELTAEPTVTHEPAATLIESSDARVVAGGTWTTYASDLASGGEYLFSSGSADDTLSLSFEGVSLAVVYVKHPALGAFIVEIDGTALQAVDSTSAESAFGARVSFALPEGAHTVRVYPLYGTMAIDAFDLAAQAVVTPTPTAVPTEPPTVVPTAEPTAEPTVEPTTTPKPSSPLIESGDARVTPNGIWAAYTSEWASGDEYLYSSGSATDTLSLCFEGTSLTVIYVKHPALGAFIVEVDGAPLQAVDSTSVESVFNARVSFALAEGAHTVRIYPLYGAMAIDAFDLAAQVVVPPTPTEQPTSEPTLEPTVEPTTEATIEPTTEPTALPTATPFPTATPLPVLLPYVETFDGGTNWTTSGAWQQDAQTAHMGSSWTASSTLRGQNSILTAGAAIDLRTAANPELTFWQRTVLAVSDVASLEVSLDGGQTWQTLDLQTGTVSDWSPRTVSLAAYRGLVIALRFRLDTFSPVPEGALTAGWWVDDLVLLDVPVVPTATPFPTTLPTEIPTEAPTEPPVPTTVPTEVPTDIPVPTATPTEIPAVEPTDEPVVTDEPNS